jgi:hypothetical protein
MARFTKCGECHNIAHDLNRWEPGSQKAAADKDEAVKATPKKAPKKK